MKDFSTIAITTPTAGFPARLCTITRADGVIIRIAESDTPVTVAGETWQPIAGILVSAVTHSSNGDMPSCQIVAVHTNGGTINTADLETGLFDGAKVQIYIVNRTNLSAKGLLFTGLVSTISYTVENLATFQVKGLGVGGKILMTQKRSPMCRTDLFSVLCGVDKNAYDVATSVNAMIDAFNFTVTGSLPQADGWFNQGVVVCPNGLGVEIANWKQSTQTITTYLPVNRMIAAGFALTLYPGCDKTLEMCQGRYGNALSFQGEPHFLGTAAGSVTIA